MAIHKHVTNLSGLNNKHDGDDWAASENNLLVNGVMELQNIVDDLVEDESDADDYVEEAPQDGKQYARQDGYWEEVATYLIIVPVAVGASSLAAQVGNYYLFGGEVGTLTITLPTLLSQTKVKGCVLSITTGASPDISITAAASISWFDGWEGFAANTSYEINAIYNGQRWVLSHSVVANS